MRYIFNFRKRYDLRTFKYFFPSALILFVEGRKIFRTLDDGYAVITTITNIKGKNFKYNEEKAFTELSLDVHSC